MVGHAQYTGAITRAGFTTVRPSLSWAYHVGEITVASWGT